MPFKRYRSRLLVEAKELDHDGTYYNPQSGQKDTFRRGDMMVREPGGKQRVEPSERFKQEYEAIE